MYHKVQQMKDALFTVKSCPNLLMIADLIEHGDHDMHKVHVDAKLLRQRMRCRGSTYLPHVYSSTESIMRSYSATHP